MSDSLLEDVFNLRDGLRDVRAKARELGDERCAKILDLAVQKVDKIISKHERLDDENP